MIEGAKDKKNVGTKGRADAVGDDHNKKVEKRYISLLERESGESIVAET